MLWATGSRLPSRLPTQVKQPHLMRPRSAQKSMIPPGAPLITSIHINLSGIKTLRGRTTK